MAFAIFIPEDASLFPEKRAVHFSFSGEIVAMSLSGISITWASIPIASGRGGSPSFGHGLWHFADPLHAGGGRQGHQVAMTEVVAKLVMA